MAALDKEIALHSVSDTFKDRKGKKMFVGKHRRNKSEDEAQIQAQSQPEGGMLQYEMGLSEGSQQQG